MDDKFSFRRLAMAWRCYSPGMGKELLLIGGLTLVAYLVSFMATQVVWGILIYGMMGYVTTITYCCGPLHFARFRDSSFDLQIPVTASERTAVMLGYTLVVVPGIMAAVWYGATYVTGLFSPDAPLSPALFIGRINPDELKEVSGFLKYTWLQNIQIAIPAMVCLLCVVLSRRNKVLTGVIGFIVTFIVMAIAGGVVGLIIAFMGLKTGDADHRVFIDLMNSILVSTLYVMAIAALVMTVFTAWMLNRTFRNRQA